MPSNTTYTETYLKISKKYCCLILVCFGISYNTQVQGNHWVTFLSLPRNQKTGHLSPDSWVNWLKLQNWGFKRDSVLGHGLQILSGGRRSSLHRALKAATSPGLPRGNWPVAPVPKLPRRQRPATGWRQATGKRLSPCAGSGARAAVMSLPFLRPLLLRNAQTSTNSFKATLLALLRERERWCRTLDYYLHYYFKHGPKVHGQGNLYLTQQYRIPEYGARWSRSMTISQGELVS